MTIDAPVVIELDGMPDAAPQRIRAVTPRQKFVVGLDLGQANDPTALCVLDHTIIGSRRWKIAGPQDTYHQISEERLDVRHLERLPLGLSYPAIVQFVSEILARPPLSSSAELVFDMTGVGRPTADIMRAAGLPGIGVTITSGLEVTLAKAYPAQEWHVPKGTLISALDGRLHSGELRFAKALRESEALKGELRDFQRHVSAAGRFQYSARSGQHDDLVLAVALACWWACRPEPPRLTVQSPMF